MSHVETWAGITLVLSFIGWMVATEVRLKTLQAKLLVSDERVKDDQITAETHALSDAELNERLKQSLR